MSKSFINVGKTLTTRLTLPIVGLIGAGVKYNATVEDLTTSFKVMTGSAEKAGDIVERLKDIGSKTPFEFTDLAETTKLLMNYGLTADDAISKMKMLGDISQGNADKMKRISMAYGQMSSAGKVSLEDVKQMIEAGFNPLKEISESTGESMSSLYDRISNGSLSVDEITKSMERSTSVGGKYFGSMEAQSKTTSGKLSTLKDEFLSATGSLTESLIPAFQSGVTWLTKLSKWFSSLSEDQRKMILTVMGIVAVLGPALIILGKIISLAKTFVIVAKVIGTVTKAVWLFNSALLANPITWIVLGIVALIAIIILCIKYWDEISAVVGRVFSAIGSFFGNLFSAIGTFFSNVWNAIVSFMTPIINFIAGAIETIKNVFLTIVGFIWNNVLSPVFNLFVSIFNKIWGVISGAINKIKNGFNVVANFIKSIFQTVANFIGKIFRVVGNIIKVPINAVIGLINGVLRGLNKIKVPDWVPGLGGMKINFPMIPKLLVGTNYVAQEGLAYLHQGEAVVPKKYNPAIGGGNANMNNQVYVNVEVQQDKFGNYTNTIKTFSNGAKNSYNYGAS